MLKILTVASAAAAALCLGGCNTLTGANGTVANEAIAKFLTDPSCAHTDELHVAIGPVSTGTLDLKRACSGPQATVAPAPAPAPAAQ